MSSKGQEDPGEDLTSRVGAESPCSDMKRAAAKKLIERYFYQLTDGCGNPQCDNQNCASSGKVTNLTPNQAAAQAIQLFSQEARLCDGTQPSKVARTTLEPRPASLAKSLPIKSVNPTCSVEGIAPNADHNSKATSPRNSLKLSNTVFNFRPCKIYPVPTRPNTVKNRRSSPANTISDIDMSLYNSKIAVLKNADSKTAHVGKNKKNYQSNANFVCNSKCCSFPKIFQTNSVSLNNRHSLNTNHKVTVATDISKLEGNVICDRNFNLKTDITLNDVSITEEADGVDNDIDMSLSKNNSTVQKNSDLKITHIGQKNETDQLNENFVCNSKRSSFSKISPTNSGSLNHKHLVDTEVDSPKTNHNDIVATDISKLEGNVIPNGSSNFRTDNVFTEVVNNVRSNLEFSTRTLTLVPAVSRYSLKSIDLVSESSSSSILYLCSVPITRRILADKSTVQKNRSRESRRAGIRQQADGIARARNPRQARRTINLQRTGRGKRKLRQLVRKLMVLAMYLRNLKAKKLPRFATLN